MGVCQLGLRLGLDRGIDRKGDVVGLIDGRRFEALLGESVARFERLQLQLVRCLDDLVELGLQPFVVLQPDRSTQQKIEGRVEVVLGGLQVAGRIVGLAARVLGFGARDQLLHGLHRGRRQRPGPARTGARRRKSGVSLPAEGSWRRGADRRAGKAAGVAIKKIHSIVHRAFGEKSPKQALPQLYERFTEGSIVRRSVVTESIMVAQGRKLYTSG